MIRKWIRRPNTELSDVKGKNISVFDNENYLLSVRLNAVCKLG